MQVSGRIYMKPIFKAKRYILILVLRISFRKPFHTYVLWTCWDMLAMQYKNQQKGALELALVNTKMSWLCYFSFKVWIGYGQSRNVDLISWLLGIICVSSWLTASCLVISKRNMIPKSHQTNLESYILIKLCCVFITHKKTRPF